MARTRRLRSRRPGLRSRRLRLRLRSKLSILLIVLAAFIGLLILVWAANTVQTAIEAERYVVVGQPTISAGFIDQVLERYHSPAAGKGQALYDDGIKYGIDPVYALAFFLEESRFGTTGVARFTHSLGNIRATPGYDQYEGYRRYRTWEEGFDDWYRLIARQYVGQWRLYTIDQIVPIYAPGSDNNDVQAYINTVKQAVDMWRNGEIAV